MSFQPPDPDCQLCPRLADFRAEQRAQHPDWFNSPVAAFGDRNGEVLIAGLAPGMRGANRTGRPFTGDYAGDLLYQTLSKFGLANGKYQANVDDGLVLSNCVILNAVRCLPPQNKPTPAEIKQCNQFFAGEIATLPRLKCILALGRIAHEAILTGQGLVRARYPFGHNARHDLPSGLVMFNSYHCSRYNTNTGRLTEEMFEDVFEQITGFLKG